MSNAKAVTFTKKGEAYLVHIHNTLENLSVDREVPKERVHRVLGSWYTNLLLNGQRRLVLDRRQVSNISDFWGVKQD